MSFRVKSIFVASLMTLFIAGTVAARAQGIPISVGGLDLSSSNDYPSPGQSVTITAQSYSIDVNAANLTWSVNGGIAKQGIGLTTFSINAPELGKKMNIAVTATTPDGATVANSISINSGSVDMIVESGGYVPPFFRGKMNVAYQNMVTITAMPHIADSSLNEYDPKDLIYKWERNGSVFEDQSGYGKQSISLYGDIVPEPYSIKVTVSTRDGVSESVGTVSVIPGSPSISFYTNDPLYGPLFNKAIGGNIALGSQNEKDVLAVPYGFNKPSGSLGALQLTWLINGTEAPDLAMDDSIVLRAPDDSTGASDVELKIQNSKDFLEEADAAFSASFSATSSAASSTPINF